MQLKFGERQSVTSLLYPWIFLQKDNQLVLSGRLNQTDPTATINNNKLNGEFKKLFTVWT